MSSQTIALLTCALLMAGCQTQYETRVYKVWPEFFVPEDELRDPLVGRTNTLQRAWLPEHKSQEDDLREVLRSMDVTFTQNTYLVADTNRCLIEFRHTPEKCRLMDTLMTPLGKDREDSRPCSVRR